MMDSESICGRDRLRDYAFDELAVPERAAVEWHVAACAACGEELAQLQLTTTALRVLPDREIPQRIAFVSDRVFQPSPVARFLRAFWNSGPRLVFASACVLAAAVLVSALHKPAEVRVIRQTGMAQADVSNEINRAVSAAVAQVREQIRAEDAQILKAALAAADRRADERRRSLMVAMGEELNIVEKRLGVYREYAMTAPARDNVADGAK